MEVIARSFFQDILKCAERPEILVLHGARQTGKSTTLKWWLEQERSRGRVGVYLDAEDPAVLEVLNAGVPSFLAYLAALGFQPGRLSVALDEVQYMDDPSRFLKLLFDHHRDELRLAVSGSSSFAIKSKFRESLVGRTLPFEVHGLTFEERTRFLGKAWDFSLRWPAPLHEQARIVFTDLAETGSYPGLVGVADRDLKARLLRQILQTYVQTDVRELGRVRYPDRFEALIKVLAAQAGNLLQTTEVANTLRMARETVEEYLYLLEQTYVVQRVRPFFHNLRSELSKAPKIYFEDNGLLALSRGRSFVPMDGPLLENAVYTELRKRVGQEGLRFWRTTEGQEVDFLVNEELAIEVKRHPLASDTKHLRKLKSVYPHFRCLVCGCEAPRDLPDGIEFCYPWELQHYL